MRNSFIIIMFIVGVSIFLYPIISNLVTTKAHVSVINDYETTITKLDDDELRDEKLKIDEYNETLKTSPVRFSDPFLSDDEEGRTAHKSYYNVLNIGPAIGSIEIPKINVHLAIYHGTTSEVLSRGVGHLENSTLPNGQIG